MADKYQTEQGAFINIVPRSGLVAMTCFESLILFWVVVFPFAPELCQLFPVTRELCWSLYGTSGFCRSHL